MTTPAEWMSEQAAAAWLDVPIEDVIEAVQDGTLPALIIGPHIRINRQELINMAITRKHHQLTPEAFVTQVSQPSTKGIPLPAGMTWLEDLHADDPTHYDYLWPKEQEVEKFTSVWTSVISLQGKRILVDVRQGTRSVPIGDEDHRMTKQDRGRLYVFFNKLDVIEIVQTRDPAYYASLIKPDGKRPLRIGEMPPPLYRNSVLVSYREVTGMVGKGVPNGTAVLISAEDRRSAVHHAAARWLIQNHYPVEPSA